MIQYYPVLRIRQGGSKQSRLRVLVGFSPLLLRCL